MMSFLLGAATGAYLASKYRTKIATLSDRIGIPESLPQNVKDCIRVCMPDYWLQSSSTCQEWSKSLESRLDSGADISDCDGYTVKVDGVEIWVSNFPFAYGCIYRAGRKNGPLPSRLVRLKLRRAVSAATTHPSAWEGKA